MIDDICAGANAVTSSGQKKEKTNGEARLYIALRSLLEKSSRSPPIPRTQALRRTNFI